MKTQLYNDIKSSIGKEVSQVISEQFNIGNMDFNNIKQNPNKNIFNKNVINYQEIYNKILNNDLLSDIEFDLLNNDISSFKPKSNTDVHKIIYYYS